MSEFCEHIRFGQKAGFVSQLEALALHQKGCPVCTYEAAAPPVNLMEGPSDYDRDEYPILI